MSFSEDLRNYIKAVYPLVWITTQEDERCLNDIRNVCKDNNNPVYLWRMTKGWQEVKDSLPGPQVESDGSNGPDRDIFSIITKPENGVFIMLNMHHFMDNPLVLQAIKDILPLCGSTARHLIFVSPAVTLPPELEKEVVLLDYSLPTIKELEDLFEDIVEDVEIFKDNPPQAEPFARAALGMTIQEATNAFALSAVIHTKNLGNVESIEVVMKQKMQTIKKSGLLEFWPAAEDLSGVGGLGEFKHWLHRCQVAFRPDVQARHVAMPKGILLMGIPGTGKSMTAKAVAKQWGWPMLKMDIGRMFNSYVGNSEANVRAALKLAEAVSPVVLMIDELDKGMAGIGGSGSSDSGVTARVLGTILTWMQDKTAPVFVVATVNRVKGLPPELLRKGRFDEIFWVNLPNQRERAEILKIHLAKREMDIWDDLWPAATNGFSGSEIEAVCAEALLTAFADEREVNTSDMKFSIEKLIPLSKTMAEDIKEMTAWAKNRAQSANTPLVDFMSPTGLRQLDLRGNE